MFKSVGDKAVISASVLRALIGIGVGSIIFCEGLEDCLAGGPITNGVATRSQTMQNAFTAIADDTSAVYYNPAGLTQLRNSEVSINGFLLFPKIQYENTLTSQSAVSDQSIFGGSIFAIAPVSDKTCLGIGIYAPFARETNFGVSPAVGNVEHQAKILRVDVAPTIATKLDELSIGGGLVASYAKFSSNVLSFDEEGSGYGLSAQGGLLYSGFMRTKLGVTYRAPMTVKLNGSGQLAGVGNGAFSADLRFPAELDLGASYEITPRWRMSIDVDWQRWSQTGDFQRRYSNPIMTAVGTTHLEADDSFTYRIGVLGKMTEKDELRAGYSYVKAAVPQMNIIPAQPDFDINIVSIGYSRHFEKLRLDVGLERQQMQSRVSSSPPFPGIYKMEMNTLLLGLSYEVN